MRPGQLFPNQFEIAIIERLMADNPGFQLCIPNLHINSREFTGVGCFSNFRIDGQPKIRQEVLDTSATVTIPGLQYGLDIVAFYEGDSLTLELYTNGDEGWDGVFTGFKLETNS